MNDRKTLDQMTSDDLDVLHDALDGAYRERANLVAWLAALHPAVIAPAPDVDEPGWQILYLTSSAHGWQMTWHIHPRDAELFTDVEHVPADDPRAQWDGHSTEQKYNRMRTHVRVVQMNNRLGADDCVVCEGTGRCPACHTTMRAALDQPAPGPAAPQATSATPCPACARADQAGLAPAELHPACRAVTDNPAVEVQP